MGENCDISDKAANAKGSSSSDMGIPRSVEGGGWSTLQVIDTIRTDLLRSTFFFKCFIFCNFLYGGPAGFFRLAALFSVRG